MDIHYCDRSFLSNINLTKLFNTILIQFSLWFSKIAPLIYYGHSYEDPITGKTYRKFLPYGYGGRAKRKNVLCPGSLSLEIKMTATAPSSAASRQRDLRTP